MLFELVQEPPRAGGGYVIVCYPSGVRSGPRYAGPYDGRNVVPWPKRPTAAQWEAARDALVTQLAFLVRYLAEHEPPRASIEAVDAWAASG